MLRHCVFVQFKSDFSRRERLEALAAFAPIVAEVDGMLGFEFGPNLDFEAKSQAHAEGFIATFRDRTAHLAYEAHPIHVAAGARLVAMAEGGHDGILVFDLDVSRNPRGES